MGTVQRTKHVTRRSFNVIGLLILTLALFSLPVRAAPPDPEDSIDNYERDVYVIVGSTLRNPDSSTEPEEPLFSDSGVSLGVTWGQWQNANATATVHVHNGPSSDIKIQLTGLIPGGLYSVFYGTLGPDSNHPLCPFVERTLPLIATKAKPEGKDASSFIADADGSASYRAEVNEDLLAPLQLYFSIIYHFNGETYHPLPNKGEVLTQGENCRASYGQDAMRQLLILQKWY